MLAWGLFSLFTRIGRGGAGFWAKFAWYAKLILGVVFPGVRLLRSIVSRARSSLSCGIPASQRNKQRDFAAPTTAVWGTVR